VYMVSEKASDVIIEDAAASALERASRGSPERTT